ncbi:hypothetical protein [Hymenobacter sp. CRA2]|uniref:hypothetical protein n=1 Tax=Hymenobacter sp. CRA2 TaxID=1955620 RepID=UPI00098F4248|nr:hypothetical protein [Hymenobacter sp. CRA2]OON69710.1 hypothetical protein B0919_07205 [Hymenobacter sp. CRA2]
MATPVEIFRLFDLQDQCACIWDEATQVSTHQEGHDTVNVYRMPAGFSVAVRIGGPEHKVYQVDLLSASASEV